jgi:hypothetical protein
VAPSDHGSSIPLDKEMKEMMGNTSLMVFWDGMAQHSTYFKPLADLALSRLAIPASEAAAERATWR